MSEHNVNAGDHEDPLPGPTWMIGFIGTVLLVVIVLGVTAVYYGSRQDEIVTKLEEMRPEQVNALRVEQQRRFNLIQKERRIEGPAEDEVEAFVIPVDRAIDKIVEEYGS